MSYQTMKDRPSQCKTCARCRQYLSLSHYSRPCAIRCRACIALDAEDFARGEAWCMRCRVLHPLSAYSATALSGHNSSRWCKEAIRSLRPSTVTAREMRARTLDEELDSVRRVEEKQRARGEGPDESTARGCREG